MFTSCFFWLQFYVSLWPKCKLKSSDKHRAVVYILIASVRGSGFSYTIIFTKPRDTSLKSCHLHFCGSSLWKSTVRRLWERPYQCRPHESDSRLQFPHIICSVQKMEPTHFDLWSRLVAFLILSLTRDKFKKKKSPVCPQTSLLFVLSGPSLSQFPDSNGCIVLTRGLTQWTAFPQPGVKKPRVNIGGLLFLAVSGGLCNGSKKLLSNTHSSFCSGHGLI